MLLLVSVRHVGAHPDGHQHGVSIQISINLGKSFLRISRIPCVYELFLRPRENELRERIPVPMIIFLNVFKVHARAAKVIFVCCFRDPRGLLSRERDMFRRQTFEV